MKKILAIASCVLLAIALLATVYICIFVQTGRWENMSSQALFCPGIDFSLRMNEAACLVDGVDPYDVWSQKVLKLPYYPLTSPELRGADRWAPINAYTPWGYSVVIPLLLVPRQLAWCGYYLSMFACVGLLMFFAYKKEREVGEFWDATLVAVLPMLVVVHPLFTNLCVGNWTLHILLAIMGMVYFLNRGKDWQAGVCWAVAMVKPQLALLLAVPLVGRRKWKVCFVAVCACILASVPAMVLTGKSFVALVREAPAASAHAFYGCGTLPYPFFRLLSVGSGGALGMIVGLLACIVLTWLVRMRSDWTFFLLPAVVCSLCWTYAPQYSQLLGWLLVVCFSVELLRHPRSPALLVLLPFLLLSASRIYRCLYGVATIYGIRGLGWFRQTEELRRTIDSFNSSLTLVVAIVFCIWIAWQDSKEKEVQYGK